MIAIVDYGMGNIHSVQKALQFYGAKTVVTNKPEDIKSCKKLVLPGVGAFDDAMRELKKRGLIPAILKQVKNKKPFIGICLGMQLLFESSEEANETGGLGILSGSVKLFNGKSGIKVPHMGWNQIKKNSGACPLLKDIADGSFVYFCHSYYPDPKEKSAVAATCRYGIDFPSVVWRENIYGVQFHPEKSQAVGLKMLENFVNLC